MAVSRQLESLKARHKRVLILIDEVSNNPEMRVFVGSFQIYLRQQLPVYLVMTGLYENIDDLQNEPDLTFLHRAPKIYLEPLNISTIKENYREHFDLSDEDALRMARLTAGYPFAFQVLGALTYKADGRFESVIPEYRLYLEEYVYRKIWSELSKKDRDIVHATAVSEEGKIAEIREITGLSSNMVNTCRVRLMQKGLIDGQMFGYVKFILPLFADFVKNVYDPDERVKRRR